MAEFFCRFFCGDFEVPRGKASRNVLTPVRPCGMKKALQTTKVADFCLAPFLLLLLTAIPGVFIVHAVRRVAELFFSLPSPKKRKIFIFGAKLKILP